LIILLEDATGTIEICALITVLIVINISGLLWPVLLQWKKKSNEIYCHY